MKQSLPLLTVTSFTSDDHSFHLGTTHFLKTDVKKLIKKKNLGTQFNQFCRGTGN